METQEKINAAKKTAERHHTAAGTHLINDNGDTFFARTELVTLPVVGGAGNSQINFPDDAKLRNACLWQIEVWEAGQIDKCFDQNAPVGAALMRASWLTLVTYAGEQIIYREPLQSFCNILAGSANLNNQSKKGFIGQRINWPKSYIEVSDAAQLPANGTTVNYLVGVRYTDYYDWKDKENLWLPYNSKY